MIPQSPPPAVSGAGATFLTPAYAGTIVATYPDGSTARVWLHPDGGYTGRGRRDEPSAGH